MSKSANMLQTSIISFIDNYSNYKGIIFAKTRRDNFIYRTQKKYVLSDFLFGTVAENNVAAFLNV